MKKLLLLLCLMMSIFAMTACSTNKTETKAPFEYDKAELSTDASNYLDSFNAQDFTLVNEDQYETFLKTNGEENQYLVDAWKAWALIQPELGAYVSTTSTVVQNNNDSVTVRITAKYKKDTLLFDVNYYKNDTPTIKTDIYKTMTQKIQKAILNTVMCMSVVFAVLIFIAFIIGLLKYIPIIIQKLTSNNSPSEKEMSEIETVVATIAAEETVEASNDQELVAVITAAIIASMGADAPTDGLIVRSIRKVNRKKWLSA